jgi:alkylation response protein AidB-like acyl-CoA dehydrogenase
MDGLENKLTRATRTTQPGLYETLVEIDAATPRHQEISERAAEFARGTIAPRSQFYDQNEAYPLDVFEKAHREGWTTACVPTKYGGGGLSNLELALVAEQFAWADPGMALGILYEQLCVTSIVDGGTDSQRNTYLKRIVAGERTSLAGTEPTGSRQRFFRTTITPSGDGYLLNGEKTFISHAPISDLLLVRARPSESKQPFDAVWVIVERTAEGVSVQPEPYFKLGLRSHCQGSIRFDKVRVGRGDVLGDQGVSASVQLGNARRNFIVAASAVALGLGKRAFELVMNHARTKITDDHVLAEWQVVQHKLVSMAIKLKAAALVTYHAACVSAKPGYSKVESDAAKIVAVDAAIEVTQDALKLHGGRGKYPEYVVEKLYRDSIVLNAYAGTKEMMLDSMADATFGRPIRG